jgi:hypothetical protein
MHNLLKVVVCLDVISSLAEPGVIAMAYVPGFEWDIFLSYPMEAGAWARQFERDLTADLALASVKGLKIYRAQSDWTLGENILDAARSSAIFVAVLTRDAFDENKKRFLQMEMGAFREFSKESGLSLKGRFCPFRCTQLMKRNSPKRCRSTILKFFGI